MSYILNIETATTVCSVSIFKDDQLVALRELDNGFTHAENLHVFIQQILNELKLSPTSLNAIAVSKGPGSYTGLRIGTSTAKGLCYALQVPLISVDTLQIMAASAREVSQTDFFCPMIDARRMEVYTAVYDKGLNKKEDITALIVDEESISYLNSYSSISFFGDGMEKCRVTLKALSNATFIPEIKPSAAQMGRLSFQKFTDNQFEDVAYFEPFYLKEFLAGKKKQLK